MERDAVETTNGAASVNREVIDRAEKGSSPGAQRVTPISRIG